MVSNAVHLIGQSGKNDLREDTARVLEIHELKNEMDNLFALMSERSEEDYDEKKR
ncbi:BQ5605_C013g07240 [Microbotryum silenes-dioicae]|uniref:BQ5605_C013g07239 protein n=1 Tax=Microbotryum silenes-dioicae TaxID=796604 RepID=A0A2X0LVV8_9BASI|nr:BQ5605_C013g07239 [Microbotryum silenes-dioicae]SGY15084.1 BQ5605_C013g07240 [Microbotryum silenes-dioicae]